MNETIGAHLRNLLSPYATIINVLEDLNSSKTSLKDKNCLLQYITDCNNIKLYKDNLESFKQLSLKLDKIVMVTLKKEK